MAVSVRLNELSMPWLDRRRLVGLALAALAGFLVLMLTQPDPRVGILVAANDLVPGRALTQDDVAVRYVASSVGLVEGTTIGDLSEWSLRAPIDAGEPLIPSNLQPPELLAYPNVIALSLDQSHAVLGRLVAGDRVDIYRTSDRGLSRRRSPSWLQPACTWWNRALQSRASTPIVSIFSSPWMRTLHFSSRDRLVMVRSTWSGLHHDGAGCHGAFGKGVGTKPRGIRQGYRSDPCRSQSVPTP